METEQNVDILFSILAGTLAILLFAVAIIIFFIVYRKRLFEKQLHIERKESEHRLELLKTTIETTEVERKRIAGDLHDEIGSHLSTIRMALNAIKSKTISDPQIIELTNESKTILDNTIESVRNISHNLLPPGLEKFGLTATASDLCQKISQHSEIQVIFKAEQLPELKSQQELAVYRILQELLNNSIKHSEATVISVNMFTESKLFRFDYSDNGKGFDPELNEMGSGLGLRNIESRIKALMGNYKINAKNGHGFNIEIQFSTDLN